MANITDSIDRHELSDTFAYKTLRKIGGRIRRGLMHLPPRLMAAGLPPSWVGYRWMAEEKVAAYFARHRRTLAPAESYETIHPRAVAANPLPLNVFDRETLPKERGWWGYSFYDVPERVSDETFIATVADCRIYFAFDSRKQFYPCIVTKDDRALYLREIAFKPHHFPVVREARQPIRIQQATWILERVYHNHSHWLTAHLPKLNLLKSRQALENVLLPPSLGGAMDASLRLLGLDPADFQTFDPTRPIEVKELTVVGTDRFRPELLRPVRDTLAIAGTRPPERRIFISRARSHGRQLVNEDEIWPILRNAGFERVFMEELSFEEQVRLMGETAVLLAPHGAGMTNMMFCPAGAQVVEIADLGFPNPNFYALASAMGHGYRIVPAQALGEVHPLHKDLAVNPSAVREAIGQIEAAKAAE
ncbi:MAG: glycosyltransferase family 61 protein [Alphaproteobacteria bacterium]